MSSCGKKKNTETVAQYRKRCGPRPLGMIMKMGEGDDKLELIKLYNKALKMMPGSPAQKKIKKQISALRKKLKMNEAPRKPRKKGQHRNSPNHSDLYTDENPKGTIHGLKFATVKDATKSVSKIKSSGKSHAHKIQAAVAMEQRAREMGKSSQAAVYRKFINQMKKKTKAKNEIREQKEIKKVIGVYGGRFQPFGPHHLKTYQWLESRVDEAYITTSDIKKPPRHPMNFNEKVRHMAKMGVPKNRIIKEATPYVAKNTLSKSDPNTTAVVYIFGKKDAGRLQGGTKKSGGKTYYQDYKKNRNNLQGHEEHGYFLVAPHTSMSIGGNEISGTTMRNILGSPKIKDEDRPKIFKKLFGYFDKGLYNMMTNKFKKLFEVKQHNDKRELLLMGGAYGHMSHPFDDNDLTFGDLKNIITLGLGGKLDREDGVTEKLDGQNLMVCWIDGELKAARNKGHLKNKGATAPNTNGIKTVSYTHLTLPTKA